MSKPSFEHCQGQSDTFAYVYKQSPSSLSRGMIIYLYISSVKWLPISVHTNYSDGYRLPWPLRVTTIITATDRKSSTHPLPSLFTANPILGPHFRLAVFALRALICQVSPVQSRGDLSKLCASVGHIKAGTKSFYPDLSCYHGVRPCR